MVASNEISLDRSLPDTRMPECKDWHYPAELPKVGFYQNIKSSKLTFLTEYQFKSPFDWSLPCWRLLLWSSSITRVARFCWGPYIVLSTGQDDDDLKGNSNDIIRLRMRKVFFIWFNQFCSENRVSIDSVLCIQDPSAVLRRSSLGRWLFRQGRPGRGDIRNNWDSDGIR